MKTDIRKMIAEAYELEGLLLLADNRGADTPEYVFTAIGEKLDRLQMLLGEREGDEAKKRRKTPVWWRTTWRCRKRRAGGGRA